MLGTHYLGRIHKGGVVTDERIVSSIATPKVIRRGEYSWTFTSYREVTTDHGIAHYARLAKFSSNGTVPAIDPTQHVEVATSVPNLLQASSPFVYLPAHSGLAYQHVWNKIEQRTFVDRFVELVRAANPLFSVLEIEPIADAKDVWRRIAGLSKIIRIHAKVHPPNPLFGRYWASLKEYLDHRGLEQIKHDEIASRDGPGVRTELRQVVEQLAEGRSLEAINDALAIGDSAFLMAMDGYGSGRIVGYQHRNEVVIRTQDVVQSFRLDANAPPEELARKADRILTEINLHRELKH